MGGAEVRGKSTARSRREKENWEFAELARLLPLPSAITSQLDKASVVRLTTSYLNLRKVFPDGFRHSLRGPSPPAAEDPTLRGQELREFGSHLMQTLEGFVMVLSPVGKVMYISETASVHLGLSQVELIGNSLFDYVHPADHGSLWRALEAEPPEAFAAELDAGHEELESQRLFFLRIKCVLAKRNAGLTDHGHKVIHCSGYLKLRHSNCLGEGGDGAGLENLGLVASAYTLPPSSVTELRLSPFAFMFRASMDLKLVFLDSRVSDLTGYQLSELLDRSLYDLVHVSDVGEVRAAHETLLAKHQSTSAYYRLLLKDGGWLWVQTQLALIHVPRASRPTCIVGISHTVTGAERRGLLLHPLQTSLAQPPADADASQTLGAYSEHFYGPNGMHLVQAFPPPPPSPPQPRRKRPPFQYNDALTGERRFCLREKDAAASSSATAAFPGPLDGGPLALPSSPQLLGPLPLSGSPHLQPPPPLFYPQAEAQLLPHHRHSVIVFDPSLHTPHQQHHL